MKKTIHLFQTHDVERGTATERNPRPGYAWQPGYAEAMPDGAQSQAMTRGEWLAMASRDGDTLHFHGSESAARRALLLIPPNRSIPR